MMKLKKLGSIEWVDLHALTADDQFAGVQIGIKHVGRAKAREWALRLQGTRTREMKRIVEMRRGFTPEEMPELFEKDDRGDFRASTEEGNRESVASFMSIIRECIGGVRGIEGLDEETDEKKLGDMIDYLGVAEYLVGPAMEAQSLTAEQSFLSGS